MLMMKHENVFYSIECYIEENYKNQYEVTKGNDFLYLHKKDANICLVSHIDTIKRNEFEFELIDNGYIIKAKNSVLGADDRAGNALAISFMDENVSLLFTDYEETGCAGAREFSKTMKDYILESKINMFIELDRRGSNNYVVYCFDNHEYSKLIGDYGFVKENGSTSDVRVISNEFKIPHANLSVGYYNEHTSSEYIDIESFLLTRKKLEKIIKDNPFKERKLHIEQKISRFGSTYYGDMDDETLFGVKSINEGRREAYYGRNL